MARATQPVSIGGIEFDALISEDRNLEAEVPEYVVESGFSVTDAIILKSETVSMTVYVTDTPVTWKNKHGSGRGRVQSIVKQLEEMYYNKTPVTIVTTDATYTNMAIESIAISKNSDNGYSREIPISFRKIRITSARTTSIPASYGKSGATGASAGTANTTGTNSEGDSASGDGSGSNSGANSGGETSKSSILYGAASAIGLFS